MLRDTTAIPTVTEALDSASTDAVASFMEQSGLVTSPPEGTPPVQNATPSKPEAPKPADPEPEKEEQDEHKDEATLPEGYVAVPAVTDELVTEFVVRDAEGELEVPNLVIEYKANGRIRKDRLDQVVKMAQQGVFNVEREQKFAQIEQRAQQATEQVRRDLELRESQLESLLQDPDMYEAARERYLQANAPEQQVARLEAKLREKDAAAQRAQVQVQSHQFITQEVVPALETIAAACPEVSTEELSAQLSLAMYGFMENGQVPPSKYPLIRAYIVHQLTDWAEDTHAKRYSRLNAVTASASKEVHAARTESQNVKRQVARATKPMGRGGAPAQGAPPRGNTPTTVDGATEDAVQDVLRGLARSG